MNMENFSEILEQELEEAAEVKNKKSLHRYILLLTDNLVRQELYDSHVGEFQSEMRLFAESMKQGFIAVDKRFEDMNTRFEDTNVRFGDMSKRFSAMFTFLNIGLGLLILITVLFKFI